MESDKTLSYPIFPHQQKNYKKGYQKCVKYVGADYNNQRYGRGYPLTAVIEFRIPVVRYAPRLDEIARMLATWKAYYGEQIIKDLMERIEELEPVVKKEIEGLVRDAQVLLPEIRSRSGRNGTAQDGACHKNGLVI